MTVFRKNPNLNNELERQAEHRLMLRLHAEAAAELVEHFAPRGATGQTAGSIEVVDDGDGVALASTDPFFHLTEWGSVNNPAYAPMRRGVRASGLRLSEKSK